LANKAVGVDINYGASYNAMGGSVEAERNAIAGNRRKGVEVSHYLDAFPTGNRVVGNFNGTSLTGKSVPEYASNGSGLDAVNLTDGAKDNVVADNVIGNAARSDVAIDGSNHSYTTGNKVYGNRIGISRGGAASPHDGAGIWIRAGASRSTIGPDNIIANNSIGVQVSDTYSHSNTIIGNSIYNNTRLGIDLGSAGPTRNDLRDPDVGPNGLQNRLAVRSAVPRAARPP
jgi:hypothetical protein